MYRRCPRTVSICNMNTIFLTPTSKKEKRKTPTYQTVVKMQVIYSIPSSSFRPQPSPTQPKLNQTKPNPSIVYPTTSPAVFPRHRTLQRHRTEKRKESPPAPSTGYHEIHLSVNTHESPPEQKTNQVKIHRYPSYSSSSSSSSSSSLSTPVSYTHLTLPTKRIV